MVATVQGKFLVETRPEGRMVWLWRLAGTLAILSVVFQAIRHLEFIPRGASIATSPLADSDVTKRGPGACEEAVAKRFAELVKQAGWTESVEGRLDQLLKDAECAPGPLLFDALRQHALLLVQEEAGLPSDRAEERARLFYASSLLNFASANGSPDGLRLAAEARLAVADVLARNGLSEERRKQFAGEAVSLFGDALRRLPDPRASLAIKIRGKRADACRDHGLPEPQSDEHLKDRP